MTKVLFYIQRNLQLPFLEPVQEQLLQLCPTIETAFCAPSFIAPQNGQPGWGLEQEEIRRLQQKARFVRTVEGFAPDITVFADACTNVFNCGKRVFVGHGIISKGGFYTESPLVRRENLADLICVPGPWHKRILEKNVFSPIVVTGFIKSDRLFGVKSATRSAFCRQYNIPVDAKIILYAPTFNEELSAIPCLGEEIARVCEPDRYLLIKLHTMTDVSTAESHRSLALAHPRIRYIEDIDVTPAMAAADLMISDVSSVLVEFMALDRPVIAVNNPRQKEYPYYCATDIEYKVRDACQQVSSVVELLDAVNQALLQPDLLAEKRRYYADELCYLRDGRAAKRVATALLDLVAGKLDSAQLSKQFALLIKTPVHYPLAQLLFELGNLQLQHPGVEFQLVVWGTQKPSIDLPVVLEWLPQNCTFSDALQTIDRLANAQFLAVLDAGHLLPEKGLQALSNYFRWDKDTVMMRGLTVNDPYKRLLQMINPAWSELPLADVALFLQAALTGQSAEMHHVTPGCCMIKRELVAKALATNNSLASLEQLRLKLGKDGKSGIALDSMVRPTDELAQLLPRLAEVLDSYQKNPDNSRLLHTFLSLLIHINRHTDAKMVWQAAPAKAAEVLKPVWSWLER